MAKKILVLKENLSLYVKATIIKDQTADTLREALLSMILDMLPDAGAEIRVYAAPAFQTLQSEASNQLSILGKLKIKITIGRVLNKNKNPTAENANQELQKEILKVTNKAGPITDLELMLALRNMNSRVRHHGYSSKEILLRRNLITNSPIQVQDDEVSAAIKQNRHNSSISSHKSRGKTSLQTPIQQFKVGDLVFLRGGKSKNSPRELYIVESQDENFFLIRKFQNRLRQRLYQALADELILAPSAMSNTNSKHESVLTKEKLDRHSLLKDETENQAPSSGEEEKDQALPFKKEENDKTLLSKAGRPIRKVARKAHHVDRVQSKKNKSTWLTKPGWLEQDQQVDWDILVYQQQGESMEPVSEHVSSESDTTSTNPPSLTGNLSESDTELSWDSSPEQLALVSTVDAPDKNDASTSNPSHESSSPPSPRLRRNAISEQALVRTHAFRCPPDIPFMQGLQSEPSLPTFSQPTLHFYNSSRLPRPISPSVVNTNAVNDLSLVLPNILPTRNFIDRERDS